jgi:hypothetical protein
MVLLTRWLNSKSVITAFMLKHIVCLETADSEFAKNVMSLGIRRQRADLPVLRYLVGNSNISQEIYDHLYSKLINPVLESRSDSPSHDISDMIVQTQSQMNNSTPETLATVSFEASR